MAAGADSVQRRQRNPSNGRLAENGGQRLSGGRRNGVVCLGPTKTRRIITPRPAGMSAHHRCRIVPRSLARSHLYNFRCPTMVWVILMRRSKAHAPMLSWSSSFGFLDCLSPFQDTHGTSIPILREPVDTMRSGPSTLRADATPAHPVQMIQSFVRCCCLFWIL